MWHGCRRAGLEARPEKGFLAVSRTVTPLFATRDFPETAFPDGPLGHFLGCAVKSRTAAPEAENRFVCYFGFADDPLAKEFKHGSEASVGVLVPSIELNCR